MFHNCVRVELSAYFAGALLLLLFPLNWFVAFIFAAMIHELGHIAAISICGGSILGCIIGASGARIAVAPQSEVQNLLCSLAGPAASFTLLLLVHSFPRVAICGFLQGAYNLLPFPAMDGGRILESLKNSLKNRKTDSIISTSIPK